MRHPPRFGATAIARVIIVTLLSMLPGAVFAQEVTESALKAAFIYNFVRFTEWPDDLPAAEPFVMCAVGNAAIADEIGRVVRGRQVAGHRIVVLHAATAAPDRACRVLYLSGILASQAATLVVGLSNAPVLTISDIDGFTEAGGIAQFFFERGQLRFNIRLEAAQRARLRISSKLMELSRRHE